MTEHVHHGEWCRACVAHGNADGRAEATAAAEQRLRDSVAEAESDAPEEARRFVHGFEMGAAEVIRVAEIDGYAVIWVQTGYTRREIVVTPAGRKITVSEPLARVDRAAEPEASREVTDGG